MKKNAVIVMGKRSVAIAILLVITSTIFISVASAATTTYDYSSGATTDKWAWEVVWDKVPPVTPTVETITPLTTEQYGWISTPNDVRWQMSDPGHSNYISMKSTIDIQESAASITNILFHGEAYKTGNQPRVVRVYGYNQDTSVWDLIGSGTVPASPPDGTVEASLTADFDHYIEADGKMTWCFFLDRQGQTLYLDYIKVDVTYTSISDVNTDKDEYSVGETITVSWATADCCGSGENYINIDYRDASDNSQWCLHSASTAATSDVSCSIASSCAGHYIDIYVYTASTDAAIYTAAITEGNPWPKSTYSPVTPEFLIITIPLLSAVAIYFLMRRRSKKIGG